MNKRRFPAEWEHQAALLIAWPHEATDWRDSLAAIEPVYIELVRATAAVQAAWILCQDAVHAERIIENLKQSGVDMHNVLPIIAAYNDTWVRDYGPICVLENGAAQLLDFRFDGWGGKFAADLDDHVNALLSGSGQLGQTPLTAMPQVLEGGSLETDGAGTLLTTSCCLLGASRNPGMDRLDWDHLFYTELGCDRVHWLEHGYLAGDDTDGHIDTLARFCDEETIVYVSCDNPENPNHASLNAMADELAAIRQRNGQPYRLVKLPSPQPLYDDGGHPLPASYANFVIINERILVPLYDDPADDQAVTVLTGLFPDREIIGIQAGPMVKQGGVLHCASMQIPRPVIGEQ